MPNTRTASGYTGGVVGMNKLLTVAATVSIVGCATLTEDAMTQIALSFSDGTEGECALTNKRGAWSTPIPSTIYVRKSDDSLIFHCDAEDGRRVTGAIPSTMGGKIVASAIFLDLGIVDSITDKHRKYPASYVIPITRCKTAECYGVVQQLTPPPVPAVNDEEQPEERGD
jgi:hypothetical protein